MCGIAGFVEPAGSRNPEECELIARRMASRLAHRGPDDQGSWADAEAGVAMGHRRLAILDLSQEGHQPMHSADGRYVLVFNGEIYNFQTLREALEQSGHRFRGHCDTEVMLAAFCEWGFRPALERFIGMFAVALWDRETRRLHLARDRAGEKPLYYGWAGKALVFGSELKALRAHPDWRAGIDRGALALLIRYGYVAAPNCIYEDTYKLPPGCALTLSLAQVRAREAPQPDYYWSAPAMAEIGAAHPFKGTEEEAIQTLLGLLQQSVREQMVADVPVGAFLSGGIDSSLLVAVMQAQSGRPIKTFTIGFEQQGFNEAEYAKAVARHLGTDHTELYVHPKELPSVIPLLPRIYDAPLADPSQIPTVLLCQLARQQVKVSLSGDGGDELFGGYDHYRKTERLWQAIAWVPRPVRERFARSLKSLSRVGLNTRFACRLSNFSEVLPASTDRSLYELFIAPNRAASGWLKDAAGPEFPLDEFPAWERLRELLQRMTCLDFVTYLPDDILVKVDRAAMAVGLETRVPLLDRRIVEFAFTLPAAFKQRRNKGKWLLRKLLNRYVPKALVDRPKKGFAAPIAEWLRGPLRGWAEDLLAPPRLRAEGFFDAETVRGKWQEHVSKKRDWSFGLWHVLMFQAWLKEQGTDDKEPAGVFTKSLLTMLYFLVVSNVPEMSGGEGPGFLSAKIEK